MTADTIAGYAHVNIVVTDLDAAKEFYGGVFGWQYSDMELPGDGGAYTLIRPAGLPEERMQGGLMELPKESLALADGRPYWHPVFGVTDCDAAVAQVTGHGGTVQMGPVVNITTPSATPTSADDSANRSSRRSLSHR